MGNGACPSRGLRVLMGRVNQWEWAHCLPLSSLTLSMLEVPDQEALLYRDVISRVTVIAFQKDGFELRRGVK